jgi:RNA polymerase sigma-70 factor (ECF subfamily)
MTIVIATMPDPTQSQSAIVGGWLADLASADPAVCNRAREQLAAAAGDRLRKLASRMLSDFERVRWYEQTDDVLQSALLRLHRALETARPPTSADFFRFAAAQIRRELIDMARHYHGPLGAGRHERPMPAATESGSPPSLAGESTGSPDRLAAWTELHEIVNGLPRDQRDLFDLLWYQELTQPEAAELLGVPVRTLKRQWQAVRRALADRLGDDFRL